MEPDFTGWATKAGLKCSDGRTIMPDAFKHQDQVTVPLVWSHQHGDVENVLGHVLLTNKPEGVRADAFFNDTPKGEAAKKIVKHGDIKWLSIWANKLVERSNQVFHGMIREVSLVMAGANPGAKIDFLTVEHGDGNELQHDDEAIITTGIAIELTHADEDESDDSSEDDNDGLTNQEIYDSLTDEQKTVVHNMIAVALESNPDDAAEHSDSDDDNENDNEDEDENLSHQEGIDVNVFEKTAENKGGDQSSERIYLSHDELNEIKENWKRGGSMKQAVEQFAIAHGIENLELLFPDPKLVGNVELDSRRMEWVDGVINGTRKSPFSRIKTMFADITQEQARARGYIKGNLKKEEWFGLTRRTTTPTTIYKKQKLDRDDILDATELDVVAFMKAEMRLMLKEEIARAILIGDGRPTEDPANPGQPNPDKIKDPAGAVDGAGIRSVLNDHDLYTATLNVPEDATSVDLVENIMVGMDWYKGSGTPTFYTTRKNLTKMLLAKDTMGRRLWRNKAELASEMGVDQIVDAEVFEDEPNLWGIIVNLSDYNVGTDKGGEVTLFDDFDIDYNQYKYLIETRFSGALVKIRSALAVKKVPATATLVTPAAPEFDPAENEITIPVVTGVTYRNKATQATVSGTVALTEGQTIVVEAVPSSASYYFVNNVDDEWTFTYQG